MEFYGRQRELAQLNRWYGAVGRDAQPGQCLIIRGRRRVGKSRLIEEFVRRLDAPSVFFTASNLSASQELHNLTQAVLASDLPDAESFGEAPTSWDNALRMLAQILPSDRPSVVVLDELPYLTEHVDGFEGSLQTVWDRIMSRKPVLLLLVGSDLSIMQALNTHERPFYQRGNPVLIEPLTAADVQDMTGLPPAQAIDARIVTGGMPRLCVQWPRGASLERFLELALADPADPFITSGELAISGEFPPDTHAPQVLSAISSGERTFTSTLGDLDLSRMTLSRALTRLTEKGIVAAETPLSTKPSRETRYRITDSYLRFWLYLLQPALGMVQRGRGDRAARRILAGWPAWRGRAVEPLVRESLARLVPDAGEDWADADATVEVGGYWTRSNDVEIDLVGTDRRPIAKRIGYLGSVKWHESVRLARKDFTALAAVVARVPGATEETPLIGVSRVRSEAGPWTTVYSAEDLVDAWR
ncbi:ATP-binding protein [Glycomyces buryatensis]|uniref:ATP-binding protein n=1 Tax=Glycomyces buryatensis TaxID=2570927 RepID=A0A4V4HS24_9ACTN|nr:AAA family ATPase [Glycomyces buryatensis]THV40166.1 ATP-binding protein [Glycomyces buryatensis]